MERGDGDAVRWSSVSDALERVRGAREDSIPPGASPTYLRALRTSVARWLWSIDCTLATRRLEIPGGPATAPRRPSAAAGSPGLEPGAPMELCSEVEVLRALHQCLELLEAAVPALGRPVHPAATPTGTESSEAGLEGQAREGATRGGEDVPATLGQVEQLPAPAQEATQ